MTPRLRAMVGVLTAVVFLGLGLSLWSEEQPLVGGLLIFLGALRAGVAALQIRHAYFAARDDDDDDDDDEEDDG